MGLVQRDIIVMLFLLSILLMQAITPPNYESMDEEMRAYVRIAAEFLGYKERDFASHIEMTHTWANQSYFTNGISSFYVVVFDEDFVRTQPSHIRKAIAGHEVGHAYPVCEEIFWNYYYEGWGSTYLDAENCADVISVVIFGFENMYAALKEIKRTTPKARDIDARIEMLYGQFGFINKDEKGLTASP